MHHHYLLDVHAARRTDHLEAAMDLAIGALRDAGGRG